MNNILKIMIFFLQVINTMTISPPPPPPPAVSACMCRRLMLDDDDSGGRAHAPVLFAGRQLPDGFRAESFPFVCSFCHEEYTIRIRGKYMIIIIRYTVYYPWISRNLIICYIYTAVEFAGKYFSNIQGSRRRKPPLTPRKIFLARFGFPILKKFSHPFKSHILVHQWGPRNK